MQTRPLCLPQAFYVKTTTVFQVQWDTGPCSQDKVPEEISGGIPISVLMAVEMTGQQSVKRFIQVKNRMRHFSQYLSFWMLFFAVCNSRGMKNSLTGILSWFWLCQWLLSSSFWYLCSNAQKARRKVCILTSPRPGKGVYIAFVPSIQCTGFCLSRICVAAIPTPTLPFWEVHNVGSTCFFEFVFEPDSCFDLSLVSECF